MKRGDSTANGLVIIGILFIIGLSWYISIIDSFGATGTYKNNMYVAAAIVLLVIVFLLMSKKKASTTPSKK